MQLVLIHNSCIVCTFETSLELRTIHLRTLKWGVKWLLSDDRPLVLTLWKCRWHLNQSCGNLWCFIDWTFETYYISKFLWIGLEKIYLLPWTVRYLVYFAVCSREYTKRVSLGIERNLKNLFCWVKKLMLL